MLYFKIFSLFHYFSLLNHAAVEPEFDLENVSDKEAVSEILKIKEPATSNHAMTNVYFPTLNL